MEITTTRNNNTRNNDNNFFPFLFTVLHIIKKLLLNDRCLHFQTVVSDRLLEIKYIRYT